MQRSNLLAAVVSPILYLVLVDAVTAAEAYPAKPIRVVVGFAPGGNIDIVARLVAQKMTIALGEPVVVDNRGGAGGMIGADLVAKSTPDGYTLLVVSSSHMINAVTIKDSPYDPIKDFSPVTTLTYGPHFVSVNAAMPVSSIKDLIALAKAKPNTINIGNAGVGSLTHLEGAYFGSAAGIDVVHVPYKSTNGAFSDMIAGQVQVVFSSTVSTLPFAKTGKIKVLAMTGSKRLAAFPEVPTLSESGVPGFVVDSVAGMLAPAKTPRAIVDRLSSEAIKFLGAPEIQSALITQGGEARGSTPQQYATIISNEIARWKKVVANAGIVSQ